MHSRVKWFVTAVYMATSSSSPCCGARGEVGGGRRLFRSIVDLALVEYPIAEEAMVEVAVADLAVVEDAVAEEAKVEDTVVEEAVVEVASEGTCGTPSSATTAVEE